MEHNERKRAAKRWSEVSTTQEFRNDETTPHDQNVDVGRHRIASRSRLRRPSLSRHDKEKIVRKPATSAASYPARINKRPAEDRRERQLPRHKRPT